MSNRYFHYYSYLYQPDKLQRPLLQYTPLLFFSKLSLVSNVRRLGYLEMFVPSHAGLCFTSHVLTAYPKLGLSNIWFVKTQFQITAPWGTSEVYPPIKTIKSKVCSVWFHEYSPCISDYAPVTHFIPDPALELFQTETLITLLSSNLFLPLSKLHETSGETNNRTSISLQQTHSPCIPPVPDLRL